MCADVAIENFTVATMADFNVGQRVYIHAPGRPHHGMPCVVIDRWWYDNQQDWAYRVVFIDGLQEMRSTLTLVKDRPDDIPSG